MFKILEILALTAIIGVIYFLSVIIYNVYFHPLRKYPGPFWMKASRIPWALWTFRGNVVSMTKTLHEKYGEVVRIAPDELSYITDQAWTDIYAHRTADGLRNLPKDLRMRRKELNGVASIITANEEDHRRMRRLQSHAFSEKALNSQEPLIRNYVDTLISRLHEKASNDATNVVDLVKWYNYTTFDILGDLAFGDSFGCLKTDALHPWITNISHSIKDFAFHKASFGFPWPFNKILYSMRPRSSGVGAKEEFEFARKRTKERMLQGGTDRADFMSYILKYNDEKGMSPGEIESNASILIIAGSETTATFLSGFTYHLLENPLVLSKLSNLIRTSFPNEKDITITSTQQLEYFTACLEEGLRTYPPFPSGLFRRTIKGGNVINGAYVPEETTVSVGQWAAYTSPTNFTDPELFIPERWLKDPPARYQDDNKKVVQAFSTGPRNCIGKNLAYAEMRLIMGKMLWNFDMEPQSQSRNWIEQKAYGLWDKPPLYVKLVPREKGNGN